MASSKITLKNDNKRGKDVGLDLYSFALRTRLMKTEEAIGVINAREEKILRQVTDSIDKLAKKSLEKYRFDYNAILKISEESRRRNQIFADKLRTYKEEEERVRVLRQAKKMKEKRRFLDDDYLHLQANCLSAIILLFSPLAHIGGDKFTFNCDNMISGNIF
ncbi:uncharacterized protein TRIADDRAFT_57238 [Trichoplax adhaerens]|uniref:Uncharacterized protein n=1 Tax=Trichoplax adhaerens TaxID=10228 RepID=B3RYW4_TRIAD|nr:hypothetical protein TRIADDRAFT_57238 [Trichoplax adhaerens]EDV23740.1 hypothetical protein TRIADDRAFT_57238 [Trichoplax adhaerens]|eukprot:XP_002113266.1 hypothetical protein TRIADDRAFT_57238 [Trichoplax adhaerens]